MVSFSFSWQFWKDKAKECHIEAKSFDSNQLSNEKRKKACFRFLFTWQKRWESTKAQRSKKILLLIQQKEKLKKKIKSSILITSCVSAERTCGQSWQSK